MCWCRFFKCNYCNFKICGRYLTPREIIDDKCPVCKKRQWARFVTRKTKFCDCYVQSCDNCGKILCSCTIEFLWGICPQCSACDRWMIIPSKLFQ